MAHEKPHTSSHRPRRKRVCVHMFHVGKGGAHGYAIRLGNWCGVYATLHVIDLEYESNVKHSFQVWRSNFVDGRSACTEKNLQ